MDESAPEQALLIRGNHNSHGDPVPRKFLTAAGGASFGNDARMVRVHLAEAVTRPENPLTGRVIVNRIWQHFSGRASYARWTTSASWASRPATLSYWTTSPTASFKTAGSIKKMVRLLATSQAYQMSSAASETSKQTDPENKLLQHANVRRLEAEAIRDAILAASGELEQDMYGPSIRTYYAHESGKAKGDKQKGPLDGDGRPQCLPRSAPQRDEPVPGRVRRAEAFHDARAARRDERPGAVAHDDEQPVRHRAGGEMGASAGGRGASRRARENRAGFLRTLGRPPTTRELDEADSFLITLADEHQVAREDIQTNARLWQDFAQAVFNFKESSIFSNVA